MVVSEQWSLKAGGLLKQVVSNTGLTVAVENIVRKRENCLLQAISLFLTIFSSLYGTYFPFQMNFKMSSAVCLNLDQSKILSSGSGLTRDEAMREGVVSCNKNSCLFYCLEQI